MSADLFAAFGPNASSTFATNTTDKGKPGPITSPELLIPEIEALDIERQGNLYQTAFRGKQDDELWHEDEAGTCVLFDAEDAALDDEEFGDFENPNTIGDSYAASSSTTRLEQKEKGQKSNAPTEDLLSLGRDDNNTSSSAHTKEASAISSGDDWGDFCDATTNTTRPAEYPDAIAHQIYTQKPGTKQDTVKDDWEPFEDGEPQSSTNTQLERPPSGLVAVRPPAVPPPRLPAAAKPSAQRSSAEEIRPSNIPPPSILLQLFPGVFDELRQIVIQQAKQNSSLSTSSPQRDIALAVVQTFNAAARIIAGRPLRWKRDTILAQSVRIGPAVSAGGGRGMKLAAIDKSESLKEDKEAADVVGAWEKSAHLFNSTVSKAGVQRPLMALYMSVRPRTTTGIDVLKASHACALCGINRDERMAHVDTRVEDLFGEYWIEHWGHRDCRDFWTTYKDRLHQR